MRRRDELPPLDWDEISPYYCTVCRRRIPQKVSDRNAGLCDACLARRQAEEEARRRAEEERQKQEEAARAAEDGDAVKGCACCLAGCVCWSLLRCLGCSVFYLLILLCFCLFRL